MNKQKPIAKRSITQSINHFFLCLYTMLSIKAYQGKRKLRETKGNFFTENAIVLLIVVVVGGIFLLLVITLIRTKIFPAVDNKVDEFFATT